MYVLFWFPFNSAQPNPKKARKEDYNLAYGNTEKQNQFTS